MDQLLDISQGIRDISAAGRGWRQSSLRSKLREVISPQIVVVCGGSALTGTTGKLRTKQSSDQLQDPHLETSSSFLSCLAPEVVLIDWNNHVSMFKFMKIFICMEEIYELTCV